MRPLVLRILNSLLMTCRKGSNALEGWSKQTKTENILCHAAITLGFDYRQKNSEKKSGLY